jgi:hypothetical protein
VHWLAHTYAQNLQTFDAVEKMGLCVTHQTVTSTLDTLCEGYDDKLLEFKKVVYNLKFAYERNDIYTA